MLRIGSWNQPILREFLVGGGWDSDLKKKGLRRIMPHDVPCHELMGFRPDEKGIKTAGRSQGSVPRSSEKAAGKSAGEGTPAPLVKTE